MEGKTRRGNVGVVEDLQFVKIKQGSYTITVDIETLEATGTKSVLAERLRKFYTGNSKVNDNPKLTPGNSKKTENPKHNLSHSNKTEIVQTKSLTA